MFNSRPKPIIVVTINTVGMDMEKYKAAADETYRDIKKETCGEYYVIVTSGNENSIEVVS